MATVKALLDIVRADIGYKESPPESNKTKYGKWFGMDGQPWCMMAVQYWFNKAGISLPVRTASCTAFMRAAKAVGGLVTDYRPGDIILFSFDGGTDADHVGICESFDGENIVTIDGNTGSGNEANGGQVQRRSRNKKYIVAAYRPAYKEEIKMDNTPSRWAKESVDKAVEIGLIKGDENGNFMLHEALTREQLCVFLDRLGLLR